MTNIDNQVNRKRYAVCGGRAGSGACDRGCQASGQDRSAQQPRRGDEANSGGKQANGQRATISDAGAAHLRLHLPHIKRARCKSGAAYAHMKLAGGNALLAAARALVAAARTDATCLERNGSFVVMGSTFGTRECLCLTHTPPVGDVRKKNELLR